jgi:stage II sporulation protein M
MAVLLVVTTGGVLLGVILSGEYPLPADIQAEFTGENIGRNLASLQGYTTTLPGYIMFHNVRALLLQMLLGVFTFGVLGILVFMLPWALIGFVAAQFAIAGANPLVFVLATVLPHATVELPALLIAGAAALRWHVTVISPPPERTLSEGFLMASADYGRLFVGLVIPLLLVASLIESFVTPIVLAKVYGG